MNFNLVSPFDSASNFTARFKDDIQITKNSSVYLNHFKVERDRRIVLINDNTLTLEFKYPMPSRIPDEPGTLTLDSANNPDNYRVNIPKGTYNARSLNELMNKGIQTLLNRNTSIQCTRGLYNAGTLFFKSQQANANTLVPGLGEDSIILSTVLNGFRDIYADVPADNNGNEFFNSLINEEIDQDTVNFFNSSSGTGAADKAYAKTSADGTPILYDNYMLSSTWLPNYSMLFEQWRSDFGASYSGTTTILPGPADSESNNRQIKYASRVKAKTFRTLADIKTAAAPEFIGIYSGEYAIGIPQVPDPVAQAGWENNAARTTGSMTPLLSSGNGAPLGGTAGIPVCFFGVEVGFTDTDGDLSARIFLGAQDKTINGVVNPMKVNEQTCVSGSKLDNMMLIKSIKLDDASVANEPPLLDSADKIEVAIIPYYKVDPKYANKTNPLNDRLDQFVDLTMQHFQVCIRSISDPQMDWKIIYDSMEDGPVQKDEHSNVNPQRLIGAMSSEWLSNFEDAYISSGSPSSTSMVNWQIPFKVFLSSQEQAGGWEDVNMTSFDKYPDVGDELGGTDSNPRTFIGALSYKLSPEIAKLIDDSLIDKPDTSFYTNWNFPTLPDIKYQDYFQLNPIYDGSLVDYLSSAYFAGLAILPNLYTDGSRESYVVYINNLPLRNYKNTRDNRTSGTATRTKGGYNKNILANIPLPYQTKYMVGNMLLGYYEPFLKAPSDMKNQNMKLNYFNIEIRNALDDTPATHLKSSTVNFTIIDKKSKLLN
tara:strand:- start:910 stop:3204 length:2295 start_codon:yes stop_codon:yes gene_type:complete